MRTSRLLQCTSHGGEATPLYTWTVERLTTAGWRPELEVCSSSSPNPDLFIRGNTLWYGTYRINASVTVAVNSTTASLARSPPATTATTFVVYRSRSRTVKFKVI